LVMSTKNNQHFRLAIAVFEAKKAHQEKHLWLSPGK
jgi:hypothetical protein